MKENADKLFCRESAVGASGQGALTSAFGAFGDEPRESPLQDRRVICHRQIIWVVPRSSPSRELGQGTFLFFCGMFF